MGVPVLVGRRWYTGENSNLLTDNFEWDDDTIRLKCAQGSARLHRALTVSGYCLKLVPQRPINPIPDVTISGCRTMAEVRQAIILKYGISKEALLGPGKSAVLIEARREAWHYCKTVLGKSTTQIGNFFNRDHSSVVQQLLIMRKAINGGNNADSNPQLAPIDQ